VNITSAAWIGLCTWRATSAAHSGTGHESWHDNLRSIDVRRLSSHVAKGTRKPS